MKTSYPSFPQHDMLGPTDMDLPSVSHWAARHLETIEHEQRVARIASALFDLTRELHGLGPAARHLLRAAALVHDVGRSVDNPRHPAVGARMILRDRALRVPEADRRALAFLTLYHRDGLPELGGEKVLRPTDDRAALRKVLALLRAADALDSRSLEPPRRVVFALKRNRLKIACYLQRPAGKARRVYERRKKFRLLEDQLACSVEVDVRPAKSLELVA